MSISGTPAKKRVNREHSLANNQIREIEYWQVLTDGNSTLEEIRDASPVPAYYTQHPTSPEWYVSEKRVTTDDETKKAFTVEVIYSGDLYGAPWPEDESSILGREPEYEWSTEESVEQVDCDVDGKPIQNVVGEDFDPPPNAYRSYVSLTVSRNESVVEWSASKAANYVDHVNTSTFFGAPPLSVLCKRVSAKSQTFTMAGGTEYPYWRVTYVFWFKVISQTVDQGVFEPWGLRLANKGRRELVAGKPQPIKENGEYITEPMSLTLAGVPTYRGGGQSTYWLGFKIQKSANFGLLGLE